MNLSMFMKAPEDKKRMVCVDNPGYRQHWEMRCPFQTQKTCVLKQKQFYY